MPLSFVEAIDNSNCVVTIWNVETNSTLIEVLAWLYLQKEEHAERVIASLNAGFAALPGSSVKNAIDTLSIDISDIRESLSSIDDIVRRKAEGRRDTLIEHRDGLLFQHISWIAAHMRLPNAYATPPHVRQADKGFDGLLLELDKSQTEMSRIVLCEDKASINPRSLVTSSIWPEITLILSEKKDREILAGVTAILKTISGVDREKVIDATEWRGVRQFRVSLTAGDDQAREGQFFHLFAGFEGIAGGQINSRMAEVMPMKDVRPYLANLADQVVEFLKGKLPHV